MKKRSPTIDIHQPLENSEANVYRNVLCAIENLVTQMSELIPNPVNIKFYSVLKVARNHYERKMLRCLKRVDL